jgi:hypothetical protein
MVIEKYGFNPETGELLWTSPDFNTYTGIFNTNVYSPQANVLHQN